jgi:hypothetical protein
MNRSGKSAGRRGKPREFGQFDQGAGQRYASKDHAKAMSGMGSAPPPIEQRRAAVDAATADLMEISTPYIGGNRVVPKT